MLLFAAWTLLAAQEPLPLPVKDSQFTVRGSSFAQPPSIDGDLSEWRDKDPIRIDRDEQCNRFPNNPLSREWGGPKDVSAKIWFGISSSDLLIAGEIVDDSHVDPIEPWWHGDAIELFLCMRPEDKKAGTFGEDDYQIFLMPLRESGRWGAWLQGSLVGPDDSTFYGVRVEGRAQGQGYTFEAAFPLANFPLLAPEARQIGVNIAIDDADGKAGFPKNYLVWTGDIEVYRDASRMGRLEFPHVETPPLLVAEGGTLLEEGALLAVGLLIVVLLFAIAKKFYGRFDHPVAFPRWAGIFAVGVIISLLITAALRSWIDRNAQRSLGPAVETARETLQAFVQSSPGCMRRTDAAESAISLLSGESVRLRPKSNYEIFSAGPAAAQGVTEKDSIPFSLYRISLSSGIPLILDCAPVRSASRAWIAIEREPETPRDLASFQRQSPAFRVTLHHPQGKPTRREFSLVEARIERWKGTNREVLLFQVDLDSPLPVSRFELLPTGLGTSGAAFQGLSFEEGGQTGPVRFGFRSEAGIPVSTGPSPGAAAGIRLTEVGGGAGDFTSIPIKAQANAIWLHAAVETDEPSRGKDYGAALIEAVVRLREGKSETFLLRSDIDLHSWNLDRSPHLPDMRSRVAFRWEDRGVRRHSDLCELALSSRAFVESVELRNRAGEGDVRALPVRVFGATAALVEDAPLASVDSMPAPLVAAGEGIQINPQTAEVFRGLGFSFYGLDGKLRASRGSATLIKRDVVSLEAEEIEAVLGRGERRPSVKSRFEAEEIQGTLIPVREGDRVVGAFELFHRDPESESWRKIAGMLPLLTAGLLFPFLILAAASALARAGKIRSKLLGAFSMTSVLPLLFLLVFLSDLLLGRYRSAEEESLRAALASAEQAMLNKKTQSAQAAQAFAQAFLDHPRIRDLLAHPERPDYRDALRGELSRMRPSVLGPGETFLHFEEVEVSAQGLRKMIVSDGIAREDLRRFDFSEAGFFESREKIRVAGVYRTQEGGRRFLFVAGEALRPNAPEGFVGRLYAPSGYPLEGSSIVDAERSRHYVAAIRGFASEGERKSGPVVAAASLGVFERQNGKEIVATRECQIALRPVPGVDGQAVGFLGLAKPRREYSLSLGFTQIPLRRGLVLFGGLVLISAFVVVRTLTVRITRPIERLERSAKALRSGETPEFVPRETEDEIGVLTESFNEMAESLRRRFHELTSLNRGLREMSACLESSSVLAEAGRLLRQSLRAESVLLATKGPAGAAVDLVAEDGGSRSIATWSDPLRRLFEAEELRILEGEGRCGLVEGAFCAVLLPLTVRGRKLGALLVGLPAFPDAAQREVLRVAGMQIAIAIENARLFRLAIEDPTSGAYNGTYFRSLLTQEIDSAREAGKPLSLIRVTLKELETAVQRGRPQESEPALELVGATLRRIAPRGASLGRAGLGDFHLLLPSLEKADALALGARIREELSSSPVAVSGSVSLRLRPRITVASYPEDGQSADFLLYALDPGQALGRRSASGVYDVRERAECVRVETSAGETVFRSPRMIEILGIVDRIAGSDLPVLLQGETGVGKEVIADLIQQQSGRSGRPYVKINCAAIPESLLESELFGAEKGAFTGATERRVGRFEAAHGGTVFLDEVGELPLVVQAKLLRVLQEKKVTRLGGTEAVDADFRILAATNLDLSNAVSEGRFRSDLFYRLQGISLMIPPLRERREEIPDFVETASRQFCQSTGKEMRIPSETLDILFRHDWPGNVRELLHVIHRGLLLSEGSVLEPHRIAQDLLQTPSPTSVSVSLPRSEATSMSERQIQLIRHLVRTEVITTVQYVGLASVSRRTALRDLDELVQKGILERRGKRRGAQYRLRDKKFGQTS